MHALSLSGAPTYPLLSATNGQEVKSVTVNGSNSRFARTHILQDFIRANPSIFPSPSQISESMQAKPFQTCHGVGSKRFQEAASSWAVL